MIRKERKRKSSIGCYMESDNRREYEFSTQEILDEEMRGSVWLVILRSGDERDEPSGEEIFDKGYRGADGR